MTLTSHQDLRPETIDGELLTIFALGKEVVFEDGMKSAFSSGLITFIKRYGNVAVEALADSIASYKVNLEIASEALRWVGQIENDATHQQRLRLLEHSLSSSSARIRDAASLGLAFMDDPHAIPYLEQAFDKEEIDLLRDNLLQVLEQLHPCVSD
jgi:hypothetical protein